MVTTFGMLSVGRRLCSAGSGSESAPGLNWAGCHAIAFTHIDKAGIALHHGRARFDDGFEVVMQRIVGNNAAADVIQTINIHVVVQSMATLAPTWRVLRIMSRRGLQWERRLLFKPKAEWFRAVASTVSSGDGRAPSETFSIAVPGADPGWGGRSRDSSCRTSAPLAQ